MPQVAKARLKLLPGVHGCAARGQPDALANTTAALAERSLDSAMSR